MQPWQKIAEALENRAPESLQAGASPSLPEVLLQRLDVAAEGANQQAERVSAGVRPYLKSWGATFKAIQSGKFKRRASLLKLWAHADELGRVAAPFSACHAGCSHCCHIPVALAQCEANLIGQQIGRAPQRLATDAALDTSFGYHRPCPFLKDEQCSIYESRPLACRLHFNMDVDDLLCRLLPEETVPVPLLNTTQFQAVYAFAVFGDTLGDIRDFFPPE